MITVENIKKYYGGFCAVDGASLEIKEGSITEFTGVHFDISNPYSYREGKRQLRLLLNKIKTNKNFIIINK